MGRPAGLSPRRAAAIAVLVPPVVARADARIVRARLPIVLGLACAAVAAQPSRAHHLERAQAALAADDLPVAIDQLRQAQRLAQRERRRDAEVERALAALYTRAGARAADAERWDEAARWFEGALELLPDDDGILASLGILRMRQGRDADARLLLQRAVQRNAENGHAHAALVQLARAAGDRGGASRHYAQAARLAPQRAELRREAERSQRDADVEHEFTAQLRGSFRIHHHPRGPARHAVEFAAGALNKAYAELRVALGAAPAGVIDVVLYANDEFARVRTAGKWAHAYYDGRVRVPIGPWPAGRASFEQTLRHELTHAFLATLHPKVPLWVNEGYAQLFEGRPAAAAAGVLAGGLLPPEVFENAFTRDSGDEATIERGYAQSLLCVAWLLPRGGAARWRQFLALVGEGVGSDAALQQVYRVEFAALAARALGGR
jgi:tetratricopeptide (TPR) repeat protein